jgi:oligo-1,6-glucosidase
VLHLHRGTPFIYQGEELGMTNTAMRSIEDYRDIETLNFYKEATTRLGVSPDDALEAVHRVSRDNARTPMQWSDSPHAGFSSAEPWLAVNPNYTKVNAEAQVDDPNSVFNYYRQLIELRRRDPVVRSGRYELLYPEHERLYCFTRTSEHGAILVIANFSATTTLVPEELADSWRDAAPLITNITPRPAGVPSRLEAWEVIALRRTK